MHAVRAELKGEESELEGIKFKFDVVMVCFFALIL
jgi:hypothetical protein